MWQSLGDFDFFILHTYTWYLQKVALNNPNALPTRRYLTKSASKAQLRLRDPSQNEFFSNGEKCCTETT